MNLFERMLQTILNFGPALTPTELQQALDKKASESKEKLEWRTSIVDLMKLTDQESSLEARKHLAKDLGYTGKLDGSPEMNIWLHSKVMEKLSWKL